MSQISDIVFRYLHRQLASSRATPAQYTASAGTVRAAVCAALVEADDYWAGAIVRWDGGGNAGQYSRVASFTAGTLTFGEDLPEAVAAADTFTLFLGGLYASDQRVPGMTASMLIDITGFTIAFVGMLNDEGTGVLSFSASTQTITWTPPDEAEGVPVSVGALTNGQSIAVFGGGTTLTQQSKYIQLTRTAAALPVIDASDDVNLSHPIGAFLGFVTGDETNAGKTFYRPVALENTGGSVVWRGAVYCASPWPDAENTTIAFGGAIGTGADTLEAESLVAWGKHGFVINSTKNDLRYFFNRSGTAISIADPAGGMRGFTAAAWDVGDVLEPYPFFDIGLDAAGIGDAFEDPADETTAPSGIAFTCPRTAAAGLSLGLTFAPGALVTVWERFFIPAGFRPIEGGRAELRVFAEVNN